MTLIRDHAAAMVPRKGLLAARGTHMTEGDGDSSLPLHTSPIWALPPYPALSTH